MSNEIEKDGVALIADERRRQIEVKGWTSEHDDTHRYGDLRVVATMCCCNGTDAYVKDPLQRDWGIVQRHGYDGEQPDEIHLLAVAGALIAAEIDRLQRLKSKGKQ